MIKNISKSITSYFKAIALINQLKLWKYFLVPILIGLVFGILFISLALTLADNVGYYLSNFWTFDFGKNMVTTLSTYISGFLIIVLGILLFKHVLMALSAPFMTPVSEKIEAFLTGQTSVKSQIGFMPQLLRSIRLNGRNLFKELLITLPLMLLSFVPVIGFISVALIFYFQSYYTGIGNMDYTLERHYNYSESKNFIAQHKGIAIGNGAVFTLLLLIPFVGILLALPIATVAATLLVVEKLDQQKND